MTAMILPVQLQARHTPLPSPIPPTSRAQQMKTSTMFTQSQSQSTMGHRMGPQSPTQSQLKTRTNFLLFSVMTMVMGTQPQQLRHQTKDRPLSGPTRPPMGMDQPPSRTPSVAVPMMTYSQFPKRESSHSRSHPIMKRKYAVATIAAR